MKSVEEVYWSQGEEAVLIPNYSNATMIQVLGCPTPIKSNHSLWSQPRNQDKGTLPMCQVSNKSQSECASTTTWVGQWFKFLGSPASNESTTSTVYETNRQSAKTVSGANAVYSVRRKRTDGTASQGKVGESTDNRQSAKTVYPSRRTRRDSSDQSKEGVRMRNYSSGTVIQIFGIPHAKRVYNQPTVYGNLEVDNRQSMETMK